MQNKAYDWLEKFIKDYSSKLPKEHQQFSYNVGLAGLKYARKQYEEALELLTSIKFEDAIHNMGTRVLVAKVYYGLKRWDALQQYLKTFEIYIRRLNNDIHYKRDMYLELVLFAQKIFRLNPHDITAKEKLLQTLENNPNILHEKWLRMCLNNVGT